MTFAEVNVFGALISPLVPLLLFSWALTSLLRVLAVYWGLLRYVWHPALFSLAFFLALLSGFVIIEGG